MRARLLGLAGLAATLPLSGPREARAQAGFVVEYDSAVAVASPAPHRGGGQSTAYPFFARAPGFRIAFRKRALHPGAAIGYHKQEVDEVYYVLSGTGEMTVDDQRFPVRPGAAVLTRAGSAHGLRQTGTESLVLLIVYEQDDPNTRKAGRRRSDPSSVPR